jgi:hypothetical protein
MQSNVSPFCGVLFPRVLSALGPATASPRVVRVKKDDVAVGRNSGVFEEMNCSTREKIVRGC